MTNDDGQLLAMLAATDEVRAAIRVALEIEEER